MRLLVVVGARPQFVKAAALLPALRRRAATILVDTGQHDDPRMVDAHFAGLGLSEPDLRLEVPRFQRSVRMTVMVGGLQEVLAEHAPDRVVVMGDTDTALAGATAAVGADLPVAHVEAGARSGEPDLPEEQNRLRIDEIADLLFCATPAHARNLAGRDGVHVVGDVMADVLLAREREIRERTPARDAYAVLTLHRAATADDPLAVARVLQAAGAAGVPVVFPKHPRTRIAGEPPRSVEVRPPLPYLDFLGLVAGARLVLTDSGGLQKEAYLLGVPCITLREATEWSETVDAGWNVLVGTDPARIEAALAAPPRAADRPALYGDGAAATRIAELV
ncbi:MAG: non-hydrolyzing UDP-N-acetylglucosamine 2-epimerase [Planctomycetota bacterium]|jgi:UDP-N-acetylglucosamine 2-epimerase (non-hydrolysing)